MSNEHLIVKIAQKRFKETNMADEKHTVHFDDNDKQNKFLNDLENYPHAFVLACLMDRQVKAEMAWRIPFVIYEELETFDIHKLAKIDLSAYVDMFSGKNKTGQKLHRFNDTMPSIFRDGVLGIIKKYNGNAANIWLGKPSSASVVYRFLEFRGCGVKIATMAANILARQFRIPFSDYYSIDISPDIHIQRVMKRMGFIDEKCNLDMIIYKARELYLQFPGIIDFSCWEIGRAYCKPTKPKCEECIVKSECKSAFKIQELCH